MRRLAAFACCLLAAACEVFQAPPEPEIAGLQEGLLKDPKAPITLDFQKPVVTSTLGVVIVPYQINDEGELIGVNVNTGATTDSEPYVYQHLPNIENLGGIGKFEDGNRSFVIQPTTPPSVGPRFVAVVTPGLSDLAGVVTTAPRQIVFGYDASLTCPKPSSVFSSGYYFFLADVKTPIVTQVKLFASIVLDPNSGAFVGQFTAGLRDRDPSRCKPMTCPSGTFCRLYPSESCAQPSDPAGSVDEYGDFLPKPGRPDGYSFTARGCVVDDSDGAVTFHTVPVDVAVRQPSVTLRNASLSASFKSVDGVLRASGSFSADDVLLGTIASGASSGNLTGRSLTSTEAPSGIPAPPKDLDGGT